MGFPTADPKTRRWIQVVNSGGDPRKQDERVESKSKKDREPKKKSY